MIEVADPSPATEPIRLADGERMFRVIHGLLLAEQSDPTKACLYFGVMGALLLDHHHGRQAAPSVGMAGYRLGEVTIMFAERNGTHLRATRTGFHCWIEAEGYVIDLHAPLFPEALSAAGEGLPRRLLQKPFDTASPTPDELTLSGAHWHAHDPNLHRELLGEFVGRPAHQDLAQIAAEWYRPGPSPLRPSIRVRNQHGVTKEVSLSPLRLDGAW